MNLPRLAILTTLAACAATLPLHADFSYTETTQITGGSLIGLAKMAGTFSKQARQIGDPQPSTVIVKGNRLTHISPDHTEIIDLDRETITSIDILKRQYTVLTFEQMKRQIEAAIQKAQQNPPPKSTIPDQPSNTDLKFQVHVRNTSATQTIAGLTAKESIMTMAMDATDKTSGQTGSLAITNDMWLAPEIPGYTEVRDFYIRYALKMGTVFHDAAATGTSTINALLASHPGASQGMADMAKEVAKMKGTPVLQIMRMGTTANGVPLPAASEAPLPPSNTPPTPTAGEIGQQAAASVIASSLGLGSLGSGHKKKPATPPPSESAPTDASQVANVAAAVLVESNTQLSSFSQAPVDASRFDIPAGFKQVEVKSLN